MEQIILVRSALLVKYYTEEIVLSVEYYIIQYYIAEMILINQVGYYIA